MHRRVEGEGCAENASQSLTSAAVARDHIGQRGSGMSVVAFTDAGDSQAAQQIVTTAGSRTAWAKPKIIVTGFGKTAAGGSGSFNETTYRTLASIQQSL